MKINNIFTRIASSKLGQKVYKKILDPSKDNFWNNTMPLIETSVASTCYIVATQIQPKIDKKSKQAMQIQNILSWIFSVVLASVLNKGVNKCGKEIVKNLKPELMQDAHKIINGIEVGLPILSVTLINRFALPTLFVPISSKIRDFVDKNKLDIKA